MRLTRDAHARRIVVVSIGLVVVAAGVAVVQPGVVAAAADLITGKDIKDGTIKKADLAPKVRKKLGVPGPAGPKGPPGVPGPQGLPGNNATADGPAVVMGRVTNPDLYTDCIVGAPSGLTASPGCTGVGLSMPVPRAKVMRNIVFVLDAARATDGHPVVSLSTGGGTACLIPAGQTQCTVVSLAIPAGTTFNVSYREFNQPNPPPGDVLPSFSFAYELTNP